MPGPFQSKLNPYMTPIVRAFAQPGVRRVTFVMGTQMGKSVSMQNVIGWKLDDDPAPVIYIGPTESNINNVVEPKFMDMINECDSLSLKLSRIKGDTNRHKKRIAGVNFRFAWAGSATELASDSAVITMVDEIDRPDSNASGEGDLVEIAEARGDAYASSISAYTSTPTKGKVERAKHPDTGLEAWAKADPKAINSPVWKLWQEGTKHEWQIPCSHCGDYFSPWSDLLWWPGRGTDDECSATVASKQAMLTCSRCGSQNSNKERQRANARGVMVAPGQQVIRSDADGVWIEQAGAEHKIVFGDFLPTADGNDSISFWVSGLCSFSAKKSYGFLARKLLTAIKSDNPETLEAVYNTGFGELYALTGESPAWEQVKALNINYLSGNVPEGVNTLICTVDVQGNRLVYVVRGWAPGFKSYLIEWGELWGRTDKPEVWEQLSELLDREWGGMNIRLMGVDCGYRPDQVFDFVLKHKKRARALRGFKRLNKAFRIFREEVDKQGKIKKRGTARWDFDTSRAKAWVHSRVHWPKERDKAWLLPSDVDEDYCRQIVAEEYDAGRDEWKVLARDNHYLDCEGMNYMAARMLRLDRQKKKTDVVNPDEADQVDIPSEERKPKRRARSGKRRVKRRSGTGFVKGYM